MNVTILVKAARQSSASGKRLPGPAVILISSELPESQAPNSNLISLCYRS
jgi:hypothetical protein